MRIIAFIQSNQGLPLYTDDILIESNTYNEIRAQIALMPYFLCMHALDISTKNRLNYLDTKIKELKKGNTFSNLSDTYHELLDKLTSAQEFLDATEVSIILIDDKRQHQEIIAKINMFELFQETENLYKRVIKLNKSSDWIKKNLHELDPNDDTPDIPKPVVQVEKKEGKVEGSGTEISPEDLSKTSATLLVADVETVLQAVIKKAPKPK